ncbi:hypothetical protein [Haloarcula nitratireducens]|uniref:Uncharacterized protein n=1 Tax=Haloarcula nitratireducens TaxID=2487749 RepID=A0AAW4PKV3_9EURY|nr:hypothetical protein [Halomicroarcula nitratireducens]MBX0298319.1 hypothetical protein [Halomicroarcula nitratireducens]
MILVSLFVDGGALVVRFGAVLIGYVVSVLCFGVRVPVLVRLSVTVLLVI